MDKSALEDRRKFLKNSCTLAGMAMMPRFGENLRYISNSSPSTGLFWYQKPLRILQTVLRETDANGYNTDSVVDYILKSGCNTLVVNAGGIVDFFQNPLPAANLNPFMGKRDILAEITSACQKADIRVIGRIDFRGVEEKIYSQFPAWFSVHADGKPRRLEYTRPRLYASCYNGYHRNQHAERFIRYLFENYQLDGIWHNSIGVGGICYCKHCHDAYKLKTGNPIPVLDTSTTAELDEYMHWKAVAADRHMERMKNVVKTFGEDKVYTAEVFSMFETGSRIHSGIDLYNARDHFDFLVSVAFLTENSERIHYEDLNYPHTLTKFLKSMAPEKEAIILYGGNGTAHRYVMDPPGDLKIWLWETLSAGGRFWNCNFTGMHPNATHDRRNAFTSKETYAFVKNHSTVLTQQVPVANIGIYYSRPTRLFYREATSEGDRFDASIKGIEKVLMGDHLPYDFIADDQLSKGRLEKYALVILPNVRCMSESEMDLIKEYVNGGGMLLATFATSLHDGNGQERNDFGLSDLFGCTFTGEKVKTRKDCYQFILQKDHPTVAKASQLTELLINAGYTLLCRPQNGVQVICTHIPTVHNQPPEKAWAPQWSTEFPTLIENQYGKGKVLYYANQPDQICYEIGHPDMYNLLKRGIHYLVGEKLLLKSTAPESVHIGLTQSIRKSGLYVLSLVNTSSGPGRPVRNVIPISGIDLILSFPNETLETFQVLRSQGDCTVKQNGGRIDIHLDRLEDYCSISISTKTI